MKKLILISALLILGCSGDDDSNNPTSNPLIGTWTIQSHVVAGSAWVLNSCDLQESYVVTENTLTHREYEDNQCGYTECTLTEYDVFSYTIDNNVTSGELLNSMEYCSDPQGVDNTNTNENQVFISPFSIIDGVLRFGPDDEYWTFTKS